MLFRDAEFPADPYPGTRPAHSFVHDDGQGWPLLADPGTPWRWRVEGSDDDGAGDEGIDLDDWLAAHGGEPLAARVPVLGYGSNANPAKLTWLRDTYELTGPVVVLRVRCTGLAAVWAAHLRVRDSQRPATLMADPGRVEWHTVMLATRGQVRALDQCEGRGVRYRLVRLDTGTVAAEDGTDLDGVLAYTAASELRAPLFVAGKPVRCTEIAQAAAMSLTGEPGPDGLDVVPIPDVPDPADWPRRAFVYGTLRPGDVAWHRIRPYVEGEPAATTLPGTLYDTGLGYPALLPGTEGAVPGWTLTLRSPADALAALDAYEGSEYRRARVVDAAGRLCWTYLWTAPTHGFVPLADGWHAADSTP
jgi:gamma-glutamylcyclotransferase (GGCT)/AIG2-like uncharacterized protein YtfP